MITLTYQLLSLLIDLYVWALILNALYSTLAAFNVLDTRNRFVWSIGEFLYRITDPVLRPIRRVLPNFGNIDLSPLVAILLLRYLVAPLLARIYGAIESGNVHPLVY